MRNALQAMIIALLVGWTGPHSKSIAAGSIELNAGAYVLVDLSESYFRSSTKKIMKSTLDQVRDVLVGVVGKWPSPFGFYYMPINETSLTAPALCQGAYRTSIISFGRTKESDGIRVLTSKTDLKNFLNTCNTLILAQRPRPLTDITGAIDLVRRHAVTQNRGPKALIIISDFNEDRASGAYAGKLKLDGFSVVMIYRLQHAGSEEQKKIDENLSRWTAEFENAGALSVVAVLESSPFVDFTTREIVK